jgi:hypothetical protein
VGQLATLLVTVAMLAPSTAVARPQGSAECRYLTNQIDFFEMRIERAQQLGNEMWEVRLGNHLEDLERQREDRCPGYGDSQAAIQALRQLMSLAAQGALSFFTFGAL